MAQRNRRDIVSDLRSRIAEAIRADGPMPVSLYMLMCLHDPQHGYYATRPAFNQDFTTAPETSQVFGELIGLWAAHEWLAMGRPSPCHLIELGPGRGVMMSDTLRAGASVPGFSDAVRVSLVEASPTLRKEQCARLFQREVHHADDLDAVPPGPSIILANEFLDCLPIRQFVRSGTSWRERLIGLDNSGNLVFGLGAAVALPDNIMPTSDEVEAAPALETFAVSIARRLLAHPGRTLIVDYGPTDRVPADTLRAYRSGQQLSPLADPGGSDLTADVDFGRLVRLCREQGLSIHGPVPQSDFLIRLGALQRADTLSRANPERAADTRAAVNKLVEPSEMGARFQVLAITSPGAETPPAF